jgi:hypothetical protein
LAEVVSGNAGISVFFVDAAVIDVSDVDPICRTGNLHRKPLCCTGREIAERHLLIRETWPLGNDI